MLITLIILSFINTVPYKGDQPTSQAANQSLSEALWMDTLNSTFVILRNWRRNQVKAMW